MMFSVMRQTREAAFAVVMLFALFAIGTPVHAGGSDPAGGHNCPPQGNPTCGDPVTIGTGNLFEEATDYESAGPNKLTLKRYYNSKGNDGTCCNFFGTFYPWRTNYDSFIYLASVGYDGNGYIDIVMPDNKSFWLSNINGGQGPADINVHLNKQCSQSPCLYSVTDWNDTVWTYGRAEPFIGSIVLRLTQIAYRNGYTQTIQYVSPCGGQDHCPIASVTDSYGRTLTFNYGVGNFITPDSVTTPDGRTINYDTSPGNLSSVTYPDDTPSTLSYVYENSNFPHALTGIIDENGNRVSTWTYDNNAANGSYRFVLSSQRGGGADLTTFGYPTGQYSNGLPFAVLVTNALGQIFDYRFNQFRTPGEGVSSIYVPISSQVTRLSGANVTSTFTYDTNGYLASARDWNGNLTTYSYDSRGNQLSQTMASGTPQAQTVTTTWHPTLHLPMQITEADRTTTFTYDANGNRLSRTITGSSPSAGRASGSIFWRRVPLGPPADSSLGSNRGPSANVPVQATSSRLGGGLSSNSNRGTAASTPTSTTSTWSYSYDSLGLMLTATDPRGHTMTYAYDAQGNLVSVTNALGHATLLSNYDANGRPQTVQDPNGLVTNLTYNFRGQITSRTEGQWVITLAYDPAGQLVKLTRQDGSYLVFGYDSAQRLVSISDALDNKIVYTLDAAGNRTQVQVLDPNFVIRTRSFDYDALSRLIREIGASGQTSTYAYDANGNRTQITDPLSNTTVNVYDALDRLIRTTDPIGAIVNLSYDPEDRLAGVTDPRGLVTNYQYDALNGTTSVSSPDTGLTANTYDPAGNVISSTDARGNTTTYQYDLLGRRTQAVFGDSSSINYSYDGGTNGIGRLTSMTDAGGTTTWTYNSHGQVTSTQQSSGGVTLTTAQAYDAVTGQLLSMTYPSGSTVAYAYDANGRVSDITRQPPGGGAVDSVINGVAYAPFGPALFWWQGNGIFHGRSFNGDGLVNGISLFSSSVPLPVRAGAQPDFYGATSLTYDLADRIITISEEGLALKTFSYDAIGRITGYTDGTSTRTYAYDASGNRTAYTESPGGVALTYSYAANSNRLMSVGGSWSETFSYDANGNTLTHDAPFANYSYAYNARNRRTDASVGAIGTTDVINGFGQRTAQSTQGGLPQFFTYDDKGHLTGYYANSGTVLQETIWFGDLAVAFLSPDGLHYITNDHLGAPHRVSDIRGRSRWLWDHDPFGNGEPRGPLYPGYDVRFPGQFYDRTTKLHYNYHRDYNPYTGRYIQSDPIGLAGGINTYVYGLNDPVSSVDPFGLDAWSKIKDFAGHKALHAAKDKMNEQPRLTPDEQRRQIMKDFLRDEQKIKRDYADGPARNKKLNELWVECQMKFGAATVGSDAGKVGNLLDALSKFLPQNLIKTVEEKEAEELLKNAQEARDPIQKAFDHALGKTQH